jgi:3-isopropylmalate dehydratase small subunit
MEFSGRVWKFGDDVDTDVIIAGKYLYLDIAVSATHAFEAIAPSFAKNVRPGDLLLAGRNFGCGSSRDQAVKVLTQLGVRCVVAESFGRIYFRNAIAMGMPVYAVPGLWAGTEEGDEVSVDLARGGALNLRSNQRFLAPAMEPAMLEVVRAGGIIASLKALAKQQQ